MLKLAGNDLIPAPNPWQQAYALTTITKCQTRLPQDSEIFSLYRDIYPVHLGGTQLRGIFRDLLV